MDKIYDVIIIGGGPAGLTSAIYAGRSNLSVLIVEKSGIGSLTMSHKIENYPGIVEAISGNELQELMKKQALKYDVTIKNTNFLGFDFEKSINIVKTDTENFKGKTVIIATGINKKTKKFKGEDEYLGKGVSYCATCDGAFTKNYISSVVGKGEEIAEEALYLTKYSKKINIFVTEEYNEKYDEIFKYLVDKENVKIYYSSSLLEIQGKEFMESIKVSIDNKEQVFESQFAFLYLGTKSSAELYNEVALLDKGGFIITDDEMRTKNSSIFAAGDIRSKAVRQVTTATSDGTIAALSAIKYVLKNK